MTMFLLLLCLMFTTCNPVKIDSISINPGKLTVLTRNIPTVYYEDPGGK
jgi:hypothetical protein